MSTYLYELPTTGAISFADFCTDHTKGNKHTRHIAQATQSRANLRATLKESKRSEDGEKDHLKLVKILDEYIPQLLGIISSHSAGEVTFTNGVEPTFSWRTTLSATLLNSSPRLPVPSLHAELAFSLLTYGFALSNLAHSSVLSLGKYEYERAISDTQRKQKDEKLNFAAMLLCRASGIFDHIAKEVLVEWDKVMLGRRDSTTRPPELSRDVHDALAKLALADAQSLAIRKLLTKSANDSTITPGPPLPKSHPSPTLIAKLHLECAALYGSARALVSSSRKGRKDGSSDVCAELRKYMTDAELFNSAVARKWLGVDAGENAGSAGGGQAVGFLVWAKKELEDLKGGPAGIGGGKAKKGKITDELEAVANFYQHYKKINDSLHFQPIPSQADLQTRIPAGRLAVSPKPYVRPSPAFGPDSIESVQRQTEELDLDSTLQEREPPTSSNSTGTYAGQGSYF